MLMKSVTTNNAIADDSDAIAYITASSNGYYESVINSLFTNLKTQGLYSKIQAFYPFLGTTQAQHKWNAKNPLDTNAAFRLQFFGGGTHSNLGYQCNGTNAYANTFLVPSAVQNVNSNGLTITVGTNNSAANSDVIDIGAHNSVMQSSFITTKNTNTNFGRITRMNGGSILQTGLNESRGIFSSTKQSSTITKLIRNKENIANGNSGGTLPNVALFIGTVNISGRPHAMGWSNQRIQFTAIHEGLTDSEVVALHTIIDNFETAIGRKTW